MLRVHLACHSCCRRSPSSCESSISPFRRQRGFLHRLPTNLLSIDFCRQDSPKGFCFENPRQQFRNNAGSVPIFRPVRAAPLENPATCGSLNAMFASQGKVYSSSRYQTLSYLKAEPPKHHGDNGSAHGGILRTDEDSHSHGYDATSQQRRMRDILLRGLRQDLSHILACLADALTTTGQRSGQHAPSHTW